MSMGSFILGITADNALQKNVQTSITIERPAQMPKLNGIAFFNPSLPAFDIDIMLFGPGVAAVIIA